jgi:hypothetical protein
VTSDTNVLGTFTSTYDGSNEARFELHQYQAAGELMARLTCLQTMGLVHT